MLGVPVLGHWQLQKDSSTGAESFQMKITSTNNLQSYAKVNLQIRQDV